MEQERYLDYLSEHLIHLQEMIEDIEGSELAQDKKTKVIFEMSEKYNNLLNVFKQEVLRYCS
tara:strand:- start:131 stop:316 length:186 start_codon:yes stop_codon:yes gene_type:complete